MPRPDCGVPCTIGCLQDLRQGPNLLLRIRPVCKLVHSLMAIPISIPRLLLERVVNALGQIAVLLGVVTERCY